jgi:hypothetical protein
MIPAVLVKQFSADVVDSAGKFAADVNDTRGKFTTGVIDTGGAPWLANISMNFPKKILNDPNVIPQVLGRRWFRKKIWSKKSGDTVPWRLTLFYWSRVKSDLAFSKYVS